MRWGGGGTYGREETCVQGFGEEICGKGEPKRTNLTMQIIIIIIIIIIIPWSGVLLEKLTGPQLVKKFPAFYGTRRFLTAFTSARHVSLSWAKSIQSMPPHSTSWRSILILSSHQRLCLPSGLFLLGFAMETLYAHVLFPICATYPFHLIILYLITCKIFCEE